MTAKEDETLQRLEALLRDRIAEADCGEIVDESVERIFSAVRNSEAGMSRLNHSPQDD